MLYYAVLYCAILYYAVLWISDIFRLMFVIYVIDVIYVCVFHYLFFCVTIIVIFQTWFKSLKTGSRSSSFLQLLVTLKLRRST